MKLFIVLFAAGVATVTTAQAMDMKLPQQARPPCVEQQRGPVRVAYHPGEQTLRCTRILGTQTVSTGTPNLHT